MQKNRWYLGDVRKLGERKRKSNAKIVKLSRSDFNTAIKVKCEEEPNGE